MKFIRDILARIIAIWAILLFVITMLIVFIPILIALLFRDPLRTRIFHRISGVWMGTFLPLTGVWVIKKGKEHFKKGETYIVICNHNTFMDIPVTTPFIPGANKTIAKSEITKVPVFGIIYRVGSVLVNRKSEESRKESYLKMKKVLEMGLHMCIYPEGTRNKTNEPLQRFHDGAFRLAAETGHAIMPLVLFNTKKILPTNRSFYYWPGKVRMDFLEPVEVKGQSADVLKEKCFQLMKEHYVRTP